MLLFISDMQQRRIEMEKIEAQKKLKQYLNKNLIPFSQNNELDYIMNRLHWKLKIISQHIVLKC